MQIIRYIVISFISGLTAVIPGVSGGTIFAIFGISEKLTEDISKITTTTLSTKFKLRETIAVIKEHGKLPIIIGLGSLISSLLYAKMIVMVGHHIEYLLRLLFIGLVIFSMPTLWRETKYNPLDESSNKNFKRKYIYFAIGFIVALILTGTNQSLFTSTVLDGTTFGYLIKFFIISLIAGITTILPGISGTNILIIGGVFSDYIIYSSNITNYPLEYTTYLVATVIGSIIAAKLFSILFKHFRQGFFSLMAGLTASTIIVLWSTPTTASHFLQGIVGFTIAYMLIKTLNQKATS